jgi:hypothetical protein
MGRHEKYLAMTPGSKVLSGFLNPTGMTYRLLLRESEKTFMLHPKKLLPDKIMFDPFK